MKLCYRGVEYDHNPLSLEVRESELTGVYRGRTMRFSYVGHVPVPQPVANYTYRGVSYRTNSQGQIQPPTAAPEHQPIFQKNQVALGTGLNVRRRHLLREAAGAHKSDRSHVVL